MGSFDHLSGNKSGNKQGQRHQIKEALTAFNVEVEKTLSNQVCSLDLLEKLKNKGV